MRNSDILHNSQEDWLSERANEKNDFLVLLDIFLNNWYIFVLAVILAIVCARFLLGHTMAVYRTTASVLINETEDRPQLENSAIMQGLGLPGAMRNLQNQIMILKYRALTESTLKELSFEQEYYIRTIRNKLPIYPDPPVKVVSDNGITLPKDTEFSINYLGNNMFSFNSESKRFPLQKTASFGDTFEINGASIRILCNNIDWFTVNEGRKLYLIDHSLNYLIKFFNERIYVQQVSRDGSVLNVYMFGTNPGKDVDFLNKHLEKYQRISLDRKNAEAERRIQFIDDQLIEIGRAHD